MRRAHIGVASDLDPAPEVKRLVGTIAELWRYPVKSMLGGTVSEVMVTERGVLGDRAWALRDQRTGRVVSAKRVADLLQFRATYEVEPTLASPGLVRIETPDGDTIYAGQEDLTAGDSVVLGEFAPTLWCVGSTLAQEELPRDPSILRAIARDHQGCLGVYGSVVSGGLVRAGDPVVLAGPS